MKMPGWKDHDRALAARAGGFSVSWDSQRHGSYNVGRNAKKRERRTAWKAARARQVRDAWDNYPTGPAPKCKRVDDLYCTTYV